MPEYVSSAGALNQGLLQGVQTFGNLGINLSNIAEDRRRYEETKGINAKAAATAHQQAKATFLVNLMDKVQGIASAGKGSPAENAKRAVAFYNEAVKSSGYPDIPPIDPAMFTDDNTAVLQQYGQAVKTGDMQVAMQLGMQLGHPQAETLAAVKYFKNDRDIQSEKEGLQSSANALVESKLPPVQFGKYDITQQPEPANLGLLNDRLDIPPMQERGSLLGNRNLTAYIPYTLPRPLTPEQQAEKAVAAGGNKEVWQNYIKERTKIEKPENITGHFITDKGVTVGYNDKLGAVAYVNGKTVPYDAKIHGEKAHVKGITQAGAATLAHQLRSEMKNNPYVKDFQDLNNKYGVMEKAMEVSKKTNNFVAVDQALITLYNKMTDPSSVVRESEYVRTPENLSLWHRFMGKIEKYGMGGAGITQEDRQALIDMATQFHDSYAVNYDETVQSYKELAAETGLSEKLIGIPYERKINNRRATDKQGGNVMTYDPSTGVIK